MEKKLLFFDEYKYASSIEAMQNIEKDAVNMWKCYQQYDLETLTAEEFLKVCSAGPMHILTRIHQRAEQAALKLREAGINPFATAESVKKPDVKELAEFIGRNFAEAWENKRWRWQHEGLRFGIEYLKFSDDAPPIFSDEAKEQIKLAFSIYDEGQVDYAIGMAAVQLINTVRTICLSKKNCPNIFHLTNGMLRLKRDGSAEINKKFFLKN